MDGSGNISLVPGVIGIFGCGWMGEVGWRGRVGVIEKERGDHEDMEWYGKVLLAMVVRDTFSKQYFHFSWIMDAERDEVKGICECDVFRVNENRERIGE